MAVRTPNPDIYCTCNHPAKDHADYAFRCERCACPSFEPTETLKPVSTRTGGGSSGILIRSAVED